MSFLFSPSISPYVYVASHNVLFCLTRTHIHIHCPNKAGRHSQKKKERDTVQSVHLHKAGEKFHLRHVRHGGKVGDEKVAVHDTYANVSLCLFVLPEPSPYFRCSIRQRSLNRGLLLSCSSTSSDGPTATTLSDSMSLTSKNLLPRISCAKSQSFYPRKAKNPHGDE